MFALISPPKDVGFPAHILKRTGATILLIILALSVLSLLSLSMQEAHATIVDGSCSTYFDSTSGSCAVSTTTYPDFLVLIVAATSTGNSITLTPSATGLTFSSLGAEYSNNLVVQGWYVALSSSTLSSESITITASSTTYVEEFVYSIKGSSGTLDGSVVTALGTSTSATTSITQSVTGDVIVGGLVSSACPSGGYDANFQIASISNSNCGAFGYQLVPSSSTGTKTEGFTLGSSGNWNLLLFNLELNNPVSNSETFTPVVKFGQGNVSNSETFTPVVKFGQGNVSNSETFVPNVCPQIKYSTITEGNCEYQVNEYQFGISSLTLYYTQYGSQIQSISTGNLQFLTDSGTTFTSSAVYPYTFTSTYQTGYWYIMSQGFQVYDNVSISSLTLNSVGGVYSSLVLNATGKASVQLFVPAALKLSVTSVTDNGVAIPFTYNPGLQLATFSGASIFTVTFTCSQCIGPVQITNNVPVNLPIALVNQLNVYFHLLAPLIIIAIAVWIFRLLGLDDRWVIIPFLIALAFVTVIGWVPLTVTVVTGVLSAAILMTSRSSESG